MTNRKIVIAAIIVGAIIVIGLSHIVNGQTSKSDVKPPKINDTSQKNDVETAVTAPEGAQSVVIEKTDVTSSSTPNQRVETPVPEESAHIPFTQAPVVSGQPETYVNTVGQCPFYEIVNEKGCVPPADIECNADWTVCTKKED